MTREADKRAVATAEVGSIERELQDSLLAAGATMVGFADLTMLPPSATAGLRRGVVIAVALSPEIVRDLGNGPTPEYFADYSRINALLARLAGQASDILRGRGFTAAVSAATVRVVGPGSDTTPLPHKTVATRAGLGWIGHSALLITRSHGAALRLTSVLTDAPLTPGTPVQSSECGSCRRCVDACPARAISGRPWDVGLPRASFFNADACREAASALAAQQAIDETICGICIRVCPWTEKWLKRRPPAGQ